MRQNPKLHPIGPYNCLELPLSLLSDPWVGGGGCAGAGACACGLDAPSREELLVNARLTATPNLIPPRQWPPTLHKNQYFLASLRVTRSFPVSNLPCRMPALESHDRKVDSVTSYTSCWLFTYLKTVMASGKQSGSYVLEAGSST